MGLTDVGCLRVKTHQADGLFPSTSLLALAEPQSGNDYTYTADRLVKPDPSGLGPCYPNARMPTLRIARTSGTRHRAGGGNGVGPFDPSYLLLLVGEDSNREHCRALNVAEPPSTALNGPVAVCCRGELFVLGGAGGGRSGRLACADAGAR